MTDNNLSKLLDKGLIRVKKRKSPKKKSLSSEKYREFLKSTKKGPETVQNGLAICTALAPKIGYDNAAKIAHIASDSGETILEVAKRETSLTEEELIAILNAENMTEPS